MVYAAASRPPDDCVPAATSHAVGTVEWLRWNCAWSCVGLGAAAGASARL